MSVQSEDLEEEGEGPVGEIGPIRLTHAQPTPPKESSGPMTTRQLASAMLWAVADSTAPRNLSNPTAYALSVNHLLGLGVICFPWAMMKAGLVLSSIVVVLVAIVGLWTGQWLVETTARAQAIVEASHRHQYRGTEMAHLVHKDDNQFYLTNTRVEVNELCGEFVGRWSKYLYTVVVGSYFYILVWAYAVAVATSLTSLIPFPGITKGITCDVFAEPIEFGLACEHAYYIYVACFGVVIVPLSFLNLGEQSPVQWIIAAFRFLTISVLVATSIGAMYAQPYNQKTPDGGGGPYIAYKDLFHWTELPSLLPLVVMTQYIHYNIPAIIHPMAHKGKVRGVVSAAILTTAGLNIALGLSTVLYFGKATKLPVTLNWRGPPPGFFGVDPVPTWASLLSYLVILYPIFDVLSTLPLITVSLGDSFVALLGPTFRSGPRAWKAKLICRIIATLPSIVVAAFFRDLIRNPVVSLGATLGFLLMFVVPAVLQWRSRRVCVGKFGADSSAGRTPYSSHFSHNAYAFFVLTIGIVAFFYCIVSTVIQTV